MTQERPLRQIDASMVRGLPGSPEAVAWLKETLEAMRQSADPFDKYDEVIADHERRIAALETNIAPETNDPEPVEPSRPVEKQAAPAPLDTAAEIEVLEARLAQLRGPQALHATDVQILTSLRNDANDRVRRHAEEIISAIASADERNHLAEDDPRRVQINAIEHRARAYYAQIATLSEAELSAFAPEDWP